MIAIDSVTSVLQVVASYEPDLRPFYRPWPFVLAGSVVGLVGFILALGASVAAENKRWRVSAGLLLGMVALVFCAITLIVNDPF